MTNFIILSSAYDNNLGLAIRNELKTSLYTVYYILNHSGILSIHFSTSYKAASNTVVFSYLVSEITLKLFVIEAEVSLIKY